MSKHTKEPWGMHQSKGSNLFDITAFEFARPFVEDISEANAKRIVQCVNACAGMDDPESEIQSLRDRVKELESELKDYEAIEQIQNGIFPNLTY